MAVTTFSVPNKIVHGEGAMDTLKTLKGKKAVIVTGGSSMKKFGFLDECQKDLEEAGMETKIVDGVHPNPTVQECLAGAKVMLDFEPDWIVAIGGGSAMDAAKAMWTFYEYPDTTFEEMTKFEIPPLRTKARMACIPSTSGTASEITSFAVITDPEKHIKYPLVSPDYVPDLAIVDPRLPKTMPAHITANTGMDVMTHAIESFVSTAADDYTKALSLAAIRLVIDYLPAAYEDGDNMEARTRMHNASTIAGEAFSNASLGIVHSMAHKIGGLYGIAHGEANAIMLPYIIDFNRKSTDAYDEIEKYMGVDDIAEVCRELNKKVGIAPSFKEGKATPIDEDDFNKHLDFLSENAQADACTLTNPRKTTPEDIKKIYKAAYYGEKVDF